ncbi:MAG: FAD-binding oxidoreductase, partial [Geminicoccaceae bacterium]
TGQAVRAHHGDDTSWHPAAAPDAVLYASTTADIAAALKLCSAYDLPVVPYGVGSSIEGQIQALHGGLCIDLSGMTRVLEVNAEDLDCRVVAGVTRKALDRHLRDTGLFFPIDPGADASLGGMAATRASGTNAVRYGTMRDNVLGLTVVLASGEVIRTGTRAPKSSAGNDQTRLFVGSEGTLGVITEVQLRLYGRPEAIVSAVCPFPSVEAAVDSVITTIQSDIPIARIELLDELFMDAVIRFSGLEGFQAVPTLFLEFHGSQAGAAAQAAQVRAIAEDHGGGPFRDASAAEARRTLWQARHDALWAGLALKPGARAITTDVCVPISKLAPCIAETKRDLAESRLLAPLLGHVGDGNFHTVILTDPDDDDALARAKAAAGRMIERALAFGGTCSGEHGVGQGKLAYMAHEHGAALAVMRSVKRAIDPKGLLNPGKVLPPA